jgi:predicted AAA+ superfamily ATPase
MGKLILLDEVQRAPGVFQVLCGIIDERLLHGPAPGQFPLPGSASIDLLRQARESLAGCVAHAELRLCEMR